MPVLSALFDSVNEGTTTSTTFVAAAETAALSNTVEYLVIVTANTIAGNSSTCEIEATFGSTRYGFARWRATANGAPNSGTGGQMQVAFTVTGNGTDALAVNHRRTGGSQTVNTTAHIACSPLDSLTENTHYWQDQGSNTDTLSNPTAGSGWNGSGISVDVTPGATGDFLIIGGAESEFTSGHTGADTSMQRLRVTEDPSGSPTSYNLMRNTVSAIEGPETAITGGSSFGEYAHSQRFLDVLELTSGTTYRFEPEWQAEAATANTGYRRARVFVLDLSVWPEFSFSRDVEGAASQDYTFDTASATAPGSTQDFLCLASLVHCNNNTWTITTLRDDPGGTPTDLSGPFGIALVDGGNTATDDYGLIGAQWDRQSVSAAFDTAVRFQGTLQQCRIGHERGVNPGGVDDGTAVVTISWGMETSTGGGVSPIDGQSDGSATPTGALDGTGELGSNSPGSATASASLLGVGDLSCSAPGSATASATLGGSNAISANEAGSSTVVGALSGVGELAAVVSGSAAAALTTSGGIAGSAAVIAFIGNSYTQNYGSLPTLLEYYLDQRLPGNTVSLGPPPHLGTSIANDTDGYYPGMTLGGMALYPTIDQRSNSGTTDATDAVDSVANDFYDFVVLTSGFRQETEVPGTIDYEVLSGAGGTNPNVYGVFLEVKRRVRTEIITDDGSTAQVIVRMTHEGFNANADADLADSERTVRLQVLGARQLELEGVADVVVPDHYVWSRLQWGAFGSVGNTPTTPVPAFASLTHTNSLQSGGVNEAWLNRSQGDVAPFNRNGHQNAIATIVQCWLWGYALWGIDPRGDTTFSGSPSGLPSPFDNMLNAAGDRIYGGHNTGDGNFPYDTGVNPSGPPDSELDLDWSLTTQQQIQDRIVAAVDDYNAGTTEFEPPAGLEAAVPGSATATATLDGVADVAAQADGSAGSTGTLLASGELASTVGGSATETATPVAQGELEGSTSGSSTASANPVEGAMLASTGGTSTGQGLLTGIAAAAGLLAASALATATLAGLASASATVPGTSSATATLSQPQTVIAGASTATGTLLGAGELAATEAGTSTAVLLAEPFEREAFVEVIAVSRVNSVIPIQIG